MGTLGEFLVGLVALADWDSSGQLDQFPEVIVAGGILAALITALSVATNGVFRTALLVCKQVTVVLLMIYTAQQWWAVAIVGTGGGLLIPGISWL